MHHQDLDLPIVHDALRRASQTAPDEACLSVRGDGDEVSLHPVRKLLEQLRDTHEDVE